MIHSRRLRIQSIFAWVCSRFSENDLNSLKPLSFVCTGSLHSAQNPLFYSAAPLLTEKSQIVGEAVARITPRYRVEAQVALLEYLHNTRSLLFTDAEYISKNSPKFTEKLLKRVKNKKDIRRSLSRLFCYHPINEFEPFFESLGLKPQEISSLLPRNLMFLNDDEVLLENFHVLCDYGFARNKIGKIYREAMEVFRYDYSVLGSKLRAYEELGLSGSTVIKVVASCPTLLIGSVNGEFVELLEVLKNLGIEYNWIGGCLLEEYSYNWNWMLRLLCFFSEMGYGREQLRELIRRHPGLLFKGLGSETFSVIGLMLKLGSTMSETVPLFLQFSQLQVGNFIRNLRQGLLFLIEIDMEPEDIRGIMHAHPLILGSCSLKRPNSILANLGIGKKRLCGIIKEDPQQLKNWSIGSRIDRLPNDQPLMKKTQFLLGLGFIKNSYEMKRAFKIFRGKGDKLQERFDCFIKAGLDGKDVSKMVKVAPNILNLKEEVIEMKIDFLINGLGYPLSSLVDYPECLSYSVERIKLRFSMYNWLRDEDSSCPFLSLSTMLACTDKLFVKQYVDPHPRGPEVWEKFKKSIYSS